MTENFCTGCNRIRVTADGDFKVCLFGDEKDSISLRDILRSTNAGNESSTLRESINAALKKKHRVLGGNKNMFDISNSSFKNRSMTRIGGFCTLTNGDKPANGSSLSHVEEDKRTGQSLPTMVDVGNKKNTMRKATAHGVVKVPPPIARLLKYGDGNAPKGPIFSTAIIAGTMGVKNTSSLIPFCHPLQIDKCKINLSLDYNAEGHNSDSDSEENLFSIINVYCTVHCTGKTGVEMEALTAVSVAALTLFDMCKAVDPGMQIEGIRVIEKQGGKTGHWLRGGPFEYMT